MAKNNLDSFLREALEEKMAESPPPLLTMEEAWKKIRKPKKKAGRYYGLSILAAASVCILFFSIWSPGGGAADGRLVQILHTVQGSVLQFFGGTEAKPLPKGGETPPTDEGFAVIEDSEAVSERMSLEEAQKVTDFAIKIPKSVPSDARLDHVAVTRQAGEKSREIYLHYMRGGTPFTFTQMSASDQFGFGGAADGDDTKIEDVLISGQKGILIVFKNGHVQLIWMTQTHYYSIEGDVTKEEAMQMANSM
ncbi:MAG TPA: DUF4367 domain-containing protein [Bacillaceae bacterium]